MDGEQKTTNGADDDWVARLSSTGAVRDDAINELNSILLRGLTKSLSLRNASGLQIEDIAQEAMLKILGSLDSFAGRSRFTTWAMTIAIRVGLSELRRKHYRDISLDAMTTANDFSMEIAIDSSRPASEQHDRNTVLSTLQKLIDVELTQKQRAAVRALLSGMPVEVIAEKVGSNRNAVYKLIHDARSRLKAGFEHAGVLADDVNAILA
ncbi:MAG: RNA polymerase sigma factor [Aureliella sp.]